MADRQRHVVQRDQWVAMLGLNVSEILCRVRLVETVAAVAGNRQGPAHKVERPGGIGVAEREPVGGERERQRVRVADCLGGLDEAIRGGHRLVGGSFGHQCEDEARPGDGMRVATACDLGAAPLGPPRALAAGQVCSAHPALRAERHRSGAAVENQPGGIAVAKGLFDSPRHPAQRCHHTEGREPGMLDGARGLDEFFRPGDGFVVFDDKAEEGCVRGDGGGHVQVTVASSPPKCGAQIGQFEGEPLVRFALPGTVPQREQVGLAPGEVARVRVTRFGGRSARDELLLGELSDRLQHRKPRPCGGPVGHQQRLAHQGIEQIKDDVVVDVAKSGYRASALKIESAGETEHRSSRVFSASSRWS